MRSPAIAALVVLLLGACLPVRDSAPSDATETASETATEIATERGDATEVVAPPVITGPSGEPGAEQATLDVAEGAVEVGAFSADRPVVWSIDGGEDGAAFDIDAAGVLRFVVAPDFESPFDGPYLGTNTYVVIVRAVGPEGLTSWQELTVRVVDVTVDVSAPVLQGVDELIVPLDGTFDALAGVRAMDDVDGDLTASIVVEGSVDTGISGEQSLTYVVSDAAGNVATVVRVVRVNHPPRIAIADPIVTAGTAGALSLVVAVTDGDGDRVSVQVSGLPDWLHWDPANLVLAGRPPLTEVGRRAMVSLTADDRFNSTSSELRIDVVETPPTQAEAHRLLLQASFGATPALVDDVVQRGVVGWVDAQLAMGSAYDSASDGWLDHLERTIEIAQLAQPGVTWFGSPVFNETTADANTLKYQAAAWWDNALGSSVAGREQLGTDPLRQRVAYALSQLLVVSDSAIPLNRRGEGLASYYDVLARHALGRYRELLGEMARHPTMGVYLSHMGNAKADPSRGTRPDENFARELMQLFTIGLHHLNVDGTPNRDGNPETSPDPGTSLVPTYTLTDVEELAKVMTGWDLRANASYGRLVNGDGDYTQPMEFTPAQHEDERASGGDGIVTVLGRSLALASGGDGSGLDAALDVLFEHPNVAPLVARHLIARLVTANPSPAYVARVARRFVDDGEGRRGNLAAVVRALLLDDEARRAEVAAQPTYGKAKEPLLAFSQLLRALQARPLDGWSGPTQPDKSRVPVRGVYWIPSFQAYGGQAPLRSASVFNFYSPDFVPSDPAFAAEGLVSPELQIQTDQMLVQYSNFLYSLLTTYEQNRIQRTQSVEVFAAARDSGSPLLLLVRYDDALTQMEQALEGDANGDFLSINATTLGADGRTPKGRAVAALLEQVDAQLLGGSMTPAYRAALQHYLTDAVNASAADPRLEALTIVSVAYRLVASSALYMVQK